MDDFLMFRWELGYSCVEPSGKSSCCCGLPLSDLDESRRWHCEPRRGGRLQSFGFFMPWRLWHHPCRPVFFFFFFSPLFFSFSPPLFFYLLYLWLSPLPIGLSVSIQHKVIIILQMCEPASWIRYWTLNRRQGVKLVSAPWRDGYIHWESPPYWSCHRSVYLFHETSIF